ncbi:MAG: hydantoinase/oxoprolinase family protein [Dehalococcoidia bacterium]
MLRVGVDIGGTFTDITVMDDDTGEVFSDKVLTTPQDPSLGVLGGLKQAGIDLSQVWFLVHGTTVAINALIERKGARTGLITTKGFEDVLEIGRGNRTVFFDIFYQRPEPLVPRRWCRGVSERVNFQGEVLESLDLEEVVEAVDRLAAEGVESIAVCFLHAFKNPSHEKQVRDLLCARHPQLEVSLSSEVLPEIREYERMSTTVTNSYLKPVIRTYLENLATRLREIKSRCELHIMQSNGGVMTAEVAQERPVQVIESGPVGGAVAAAYIGQLIGRENIIAFDMGGTTSKANVIQQGVTQTTTEYRPAGYMVKIPVVDIVEVGIGGGSIGWINAEGFLTIGPQSAGATPGPVCYDLGGSEPTITDANAVLGWVEHLVGGRMRLNAKRALAALQQKLASPLGMDPVEAAVGILEIAVAKIADTIRTVTVARGIDPRDFVLCAFGGAGPMHAAFIARELDIPVTVIPPAPGTFSGVGFLCSDFRHDFVQTFLMNTSRPNVNKILNILADLEARGTQVLRQEGFRPEEMALSRSVDMRYVGQAHEVSVPLPGELTEVTLAAVAQEFHRRHERYYGHSAPGEPVEMLNFWVTAVGRVNRPARGYDSRPEAQPLRGHRPVYFQELQGWTECPIYERTVLPPGYRLEGPAILEEHTSTVVVPPGFQGEVDGCGNILLQWR